MGKKIKDETKEETDERLEREMIEGFRATHKKRTPGQKVSSYKARDKDSQKILECLNSNETGDAYLFVKLNYNKFIYDKSSSEWYYWTGHFWKRDIAEQVRASCTEVVDLYGQEMVDEQITLAQATGLEDKEQIKKSNYLIKALKTRIFELQGLHRQSNVLKMVVFGKNALWCDGNNWDADPWLLGCQNGVLNLKTGKFRDGRQKDWIKTPCAVAWEGADAPRKAWEKFIFDIMCHNELDLEGLEMVEFLQKLFGYSILGLSTEHIHPICYGPDGRNGKSTLFEVIKKVLGDLAHKAPTKFLMQTMAPGASGHETDVVALKGKRVIWCSESNDGDKMDSAKLKELTGGDTLNARGAYCKLAVSWEPTHTLFIHTNKIVRAPANDPALWQRLMMIRFPFSFQWEPIPGTNQKLRSATQKDELHAELPGILAWLVQGCKMWQDDGCHLDPPECVKAATRQYRKDEDIVGHFIETCIIKGDKDDPAFRSSTKAIYSTYKEWCLENGHKPMAKNRLFKDLEDKFPKIKSYGYYHFAGALLIDDWNK